MSNSSGTEYALRLAIAPTDDDYGEFFLAKTHPNSNYAHVVAETDYLDDLREGWDYALENFIKQYKSAIQQRPDESYLKNESLPAGNRSSLSTIKLRDPAVSETPYTIRLVPLL